MVESPVNQANSIHAYTQTSKHTETGPETDAFVLERAAFQLEDLKLNPDSDKWEEYISHNMDIWTVLQSEMANVELMLPDLIKANIISLGIFIDKASFELLYGDRAVRRLDTIIGINRNIALGLRGNPGTT